MLHEGHAEHMLMCPAGWSLLRAVWLSVGASSVPRTALHAPMLDCCGVCSMLGSSQPAGSECPALSPDTRSAVQVRMEDFSSSLAKLSTPR